MNEDYTELKACRVCSSERLTTVLDLGLKRIVEFPLCDEWPKKPAVPLELCVCESCWLVQLKHTTNPKYLYEEFWYRSGTNEMMRIALRDVVKCVEKEVPLAAHDYVLDIGCNDGTMLAYYPLWVNVIGFDPAKNLFDRPKSWLVNDFFSDTKALEKSSGQKYKVVTALAMFYDLDNPIRFCRQVHDVLDDDGVFIVQMNYLPLMLERCCADNIVHEHLTYFSLTTLRKVFFRAGLVIYKAELNDVNAGSLRVYAKKERISGWPDIKIDEIMKCEEQQGLSKLRTYRDFGTRVHDACDSLDSWIDALVSDHKQVYAYGASTRGGMLLQLLHTEHKLVACAERDGRKFGRYMAGANLAICDEQTFRDNADYGLLLPYHFAEGIRMREKDWLSRGGQMIVPLPIPRVFGRHNG